MRGRLASAILARMRLDELVAATDEHYVQLAVRLAQDEPLRRRIRGDLLARQAILFDDLEPIRGLESFLLGRCRPSDAGGG
jgi:predicted O-linked N-acetylglucosamine transferase (SPINDLY family)